MMTLQRQQTQHGFTMVELIITIGILAVLTAFAVPTATKTMRKTQLNGEVRTALEAVQVARSEAVIRKSEKSADLSILDSEKITMSPEEPNITYDFMGRLIDKNDNNKLIECINIVIRHNKDPSIVASIEVRGVGSPDVLKLEQSQCRR